MVDDIYPARFKNRYLLGEKLGEGGMGAVFRCRDEGTGHDYAVKFLTLDQVLSNSGVQRFVHEARLLTHLAHPNIVGIYDYGVEDGLPFLVMELCLDEAGRPHTLKQYQERLPDRRLSAPQLLALLPQLLAGVALLHQRGLVHRDLKPENFLLQTAEDGSLIPKLSDFGLVAITGDEDLQRHFELSISLTMQSSATQDRAWVGTYAYMSPEQKRGLQLDARSDVYSLGLILYRLATGFERLNPALPSEVNPELPAWFDQVLERALAEQPEARWLTAAKMLEALPAELRRELPEQVAGRARQRLYLALGAVAVIALAIGVTGVARQAWRRTHGGTGGATPGAAAAHAPTVAAPGELSHLLRELEEPDRRAAAVAALVATGPAALATLDTASRHQQPAVRQAAVEALGTLALAAAVPILQQRLGDPEDAVRSATVAALAQLGPPAVPVLGQALLTSDPTLRSHASYALHRLGPTAIPAWCDALDAGDADLREQAAKLLVSLGEPALPPLIARLDATDLPLRELVQSSLAQMGEPAAAALLPVLKDASPMRRAAAATLLGKLRAPAAALPLTTALSDPDHGTSAAARQALVELGEAAAPALVRSFTDSDPQTVHLATQLLTLIGAPAIPELMRAMRAPDVTVRRRAAETLVAIGPPAIPRLAAAIRDPDLQVRHQVVLALARIPAADGLRALLTASEDPDSTVRQYAGFALAKLPPAAAEPLVQLLADPDARRQRRVQQLLVDFGPAASARPLQGALEHERASVRLLAAETLVRLDATVTFPAIVRALDDRALANDLATGLDDGRTAPLVARQLAQMQSAPTSAQRNRLAVGLVKLGPPAVPALIATLARPEEPAAHDAARLLGQFAHPAAVLPLVRALRHDGRAYPAINIAAAEGLGDLRHLATIPLLAQALRWNDWHLRREAMRALGKIAHPSAVPTLLEALKDDRHEVRVVTVEALAAIGTPAAANGLLQALNDAHADVRQTAVQALRRLRQMPATAAP